MKKQFKVELKSSPVETITVRADSHEEAATKAARRFYPKVRTLHARRCTGSVGSSGIFNGYVDASGSNGWAVRAYGHNFIVW